MQTRRLRTGKPWGHQLMIVRLDEKQLEASYPGAGFIASAFLTIFGALATAASAAVLLHGLRGDDTSALICGILLSMISLFVLVLGVGSYTYKMQLTVNADGFRFFRRFLWHRRELRGPRESVTGVSCWKYATGAGSEQREHMGVCLHLVDEPNSVCLYTEQIDPKKGQLPNSQEALQSVLQKADEIAGKLGVEHAENYES